MCSTENCEILIFFPFPPTSNILGLFHAAIAESGSAICKFSVMKDPLPNIQEIGEKLNCPIVDTTELVKCLRNVSAHDLLMATNLTNVSSVLVLQPSCS